MRNWACIFWLASALLGIAAVPFPVAQAATLVIINNDASGQGLNDPTPAAPVGGNTGTSLGAQRLIAFQYAADFWGARLSSSVTIQVSASFSPLTCSSTSALLGHAAPFAFFRDFTGAPVAGTWYPVGLANALSGSDLDPSNPDITAQFNSSIGTTCPFPSTWYYGLDGNPPGSQIDFVTVLLHELAHGLGFLTVLDLASGSKALGFNDTFMLNLENHLAIPPDYPSMTDAQRVAASTATGNLHWVGANVEAASGVLTAGKVGNHVQMFAPNPQQPTSSVVHWDTALAPDQLLQPSYTGPNHNPVLELPLFKDIGWTLPATHDFNADGNSDILWHNSNGTVAIWFMNGGVAPTSVFFGPIDTSWSIVGQRDFDNGGAAPTSASFGPIDASWSIVGTGDFNGDGKSDILWRSTNGTVVIWFMNGGAAPTSASFGPIDPSWSIVGTGDFNGDGKSDILWRNTNGTVAIWFMNGGAAPTSASFGPIDTSWLIVGTSDFNADTKSDILWRNTNGTVAIWFMNGGAAPTSASFGPIDASWSIVGTGDFNGDGKGDILWRNTNGTVAIWFMNGGAAPTSAFFGPIDTSWTIQGNNAD